MTQTERDRGAHDVRGVFESTTELVSYRYLGCSSVLTDRYHAEGQMRIRRDLRTGGGSLLAAPVAIAMLDTAGINIDGYYHAACTHIDVHLWDGGHDVAELRTLGSVVREAHTAVFTEARFEDAGRPGRVLGLGTVGWSIIGLTPPGFTYTNPGPGIADGDGLPPLTQAYDARPLDSGGYVIDGLSNRIGTDVLHHGPILMTSEAAAVDAIAEAAGTPELAIQTLSLRLVRAGRRGPFVTTAEIIGNVGGTLACRTEMRDRGADDNLIATGLIRAIASS
jgi:hypothetical protein